MTMSLMGKTVGEWSVIAKAGGHSRDITEANCIWAYATTGGSA